eukprot:GEMP01053971.1.p1 GENE.GEMP01053971.1~~GEMP01053971.1.p1  ORF type:complete len:466 (+),score=128.06 GEMP01053971.1:160-1557(+)
MTEYWVSAEKHYCKICNCWCKSSKRAVISHEEGKQHQEKLKEWFKTKRQNEKDADFAKEEIIRIEAAAAAQMEKDKALFAPPDLTVGGSSSSSRAIPPSTEADAASEKENMAELLRKKKEQLLQKFQMDDTVQAEKPAKKPIWKAVFDSAANKHYYWNRKTKESVWVAPPDFDGSLPDLPAAAVVSKEDILAPADFGAVEKVKRKKPVWKECTDPDTKRVYYYNRETKLSVWEKPADFDLEAPPAKKAKTDDTVKDAPVAERQPAKENEAMVGSPTKKQKRPTWRMVFDEKKKNHHFVNRKTGKVVWTRPGDFDGKELNADGGFEKQETKTEEKPAEEPTTDEEEPKRPVKKDGVGAVGMWEEVAVGESAFGGTCLDEPKDGMDSDDSDIEHIARLPAEDREREAEYLFSKYLSDDGVHNVVAEDLLAHDKEMVIKASMLTSGDVTFKSRKITKRGQRRQNSDSD